MNILLALIVAALIVAVTCYFDSEEYPYDDEM